MTIYATGNALGSTDPRDLLDNAQNFDNAVNDVVNDTWTDRFARTRRTLRGYNTEFENDQAIRESAFQAFLDGMGWSSIGAYAAGVVITSHTQTVDYAGQPYSLKPSIPASIETPYVVTGNWATESVNFKLVGDNALRQDLAEPAGAELSGYARSTLSIDIRNVAQMLDSQAVNVRERRFVDLITDRPDPANYTTWDWKPAIQGAIDYVYNLAFAQQRINSIPSIVVPGALYRLKSGITTYQWIKIATLGNTTFDFSASPVATTAITIQNKVTWTQGTVNVSVSGALSPCIDGSKGVLFVYGQGFNESTGIGISVGNDADGFDPCRDVRVCNVFINRFMVAVDFKGYDTFLAAFQGCRLEYNRYNIRTPTVIQNSGERMQFFDCTLAGGQATLLMRGPGFDLHFIGGSADFNSDVVKIDGATYCSLNFTNFHFEGWDGYIIDAVTNPSWIFANLTNCTILPTRYLLAQTGYNSAGRPLFKSQSTGAPGNGLQINMTNYRIGVVDINYAEDPFFILGGATLKVSGSTMYERNFAGTATTQGMRDWNLQTDAVDTLSSALTGFTIDNTNLINLPSSKIALDGAGKKVLQMVSSDTGSTSYFRMTSKDRTPIAPGDIAWAWTAVQLSGTTGTVNLQPNVAFYDSAGNVMPFPTLYASNAMRTVFNTTTLPNFALGDSRYISTEPMPYKAPPGAASVAFRSMFTVFGGTLNVSRASVWVSR